MNLLLAFLFLLFAASLLAIDIDESKRARKQQAKARTEGRAEGLAQGKAEGLQEGYSEGHADGWKYRQNRMVPVRK